MIIKTAIKHAKEMLVTLDHLFGHTGSRLRKNRDIALLAIYVGWMSFFVLNFNKELVITALELPWMKNTTIFGHLHEHKIHHIKDTIIDYRHYSTTIAFVICAFLCPLNPRYMLQVASVLIIASSLFYGLPYWTHENGLKYFCINRVLLSVGCALSYSFGIGFLFGDSRETAHHNQHHLLGSLIIADLIGEFCGMFLAYLVRETSWIYTMMGVSMSVAIPLIISIKWKFFKKYGQLPAKHKKKNQESFDETSSTSSKAKNFIIRYFWDLWVTFTKEGFPLRLICCMLLLVASCVAGTVWEILGHKIYEYHHMTEKDISDVEVKAAFVSCVFAIVSAATVAEGFDLGRKLCWFTIFNIILSLLCTGFFKNTLNLGDNDIEDVYIAHIIVNAGAREAAYEIIPNLFVNRKQVVAGWSLTLAAHYGIYQTMRVYHEEIWSFFERTIPIFWILVALQLFFFLFILCLYKWEKLSWMLEMPSRINILTETSYLTKKVYLDVNEWTNVKTKLAMPNADLVVPAKKRISIEDVEGSSSGIMANKEMGRELAVAMKKLTKTENESVLLVHQESEPMKDLLIVDSLFNALSEKALMKSAVIRAEFPIKIGSIVKHLLRLDLLHPESNIFYSLGYDWLIHIIGVPHHIRLDKIHYIDQTHRKASSDSEDEGRSRSSTLKSRDDVHEHPVTGTHVIHKFPMNIANFEKHVLISKKDEDAVNEVVEWVIDELVQIQRLTREKQYIRVFFVTIPEIGDFNKIFTQFNDTMRRKIRDEKRKSSTCAIDVLDWADMISNQSKKRVETVDRRLRLLYETCELLQ